MSCHIQRVLAQLHCSRPQHLTVWPCRSLSTLCLRWRPSRNPSLLQKGHRRQRWEERELHCASCSAPALSATAPARASPHTTAEAGSPQADCALTLYNTMTRQKEAVQPRDGQGNAVSMYCCGVTVYDLSHIGHARVYCCFDVLFRVLGRLGYAVTYVRNFTDIDDKILTRAAQRAEDPAALAQRFIEEFHADMAALNCLAPSAEPRATQYVPQMVAAIERMVAAGHAYAAGGDVYLAVASVPGYGRLSGRRPVRLSPSVPDP